MRLVRRLRFLLPLAVAAFVPGARAQDQSLSLREALDAVQDTNISALLARETVAQAVAIAEQQRAGLLPTVALEVDQRRSRSVSVSSAGTVSRGGVTTRFDGALTARLNTLDPVTIASYKAARIAIDVTKLDYAQTIQTVLNTVASTYFTHLRNIARITVLDANIERARVFLQLSRNQLDAGVATQIDVTRAEAILAQAEQARLQQDTVVYQSELALKRLLDLDLSPALRLADFSVRRLTSDAFAVAQEEAAFERRIELQRGRRLLQQNELEVRAAKYERLPSVSVFGDYGLVSEWAFDGDDEDAWTAGVTLTMPVFDGRRSRALQRIAQARLRSQELRLRDLDSQVSAEVRLALQDTNSRLAQIGVAEKSLRLSAEELRLARVRFEQGVADNREIIEAQTNLAAAEDNVVDAVYRYNLSRLELARVRGEVREILDDQT